MQLKTFHLAFLGCALALVVFSHSVYRLLAIAEFGPLTIRPMHVLTLGILGLVIHAFLIGKRRFLAPANVFEAKILVCLAVYIVFALHGIAYGFVASGTHALALGQLAIIDAAWIIFLLLVLSDRRSLAVFLGILAILIPVMWMVSFIIPEWRVLRGVDHIVAFDRIREGGRWMGAASAMTFAGVGVLLLSASFRWRVSLGVLPLGLMYGVLALNFILLVAVQHRSVWVSSIIGISVAILALVRAKVIAFNRIATVVPFAVIVLIGAGIFAFVFDREYVADVIERRLAFVGSLEGDSAAHQRILTWRRSIAHTNDLNPFTGTGFASSTLVDMHYGGVRQIHEHNQYVHLYVSTGALGLVAYGLFLFFAGRMMWIGLRLLVDPFYRVVLAGAFAGFIMNLFYSMFYMHTVFLWIFVGLAIAVCRLDWEQRREYLDDGLVADA